MKKPTEFLQGLGLGAGVMAAVAAISLLFRAAPSISDPARRTPAGESAVESGGASRTAALLPADYLDLCRRAGL